MTGAARPWADSWTYHLGSEGPETAAEKHPAHTQITVRVKEACNKKTRSKWLIFWSGQKKL